LAGNGNRQPVFQVPGGYGFFGGNIAGTVTEPSQRRTATTVRSHANDRVIVGSVHALGTTPWTACAPFGDGGKQTDESVRR
jgi:hypothetical protein